MEMIRSTSSTGSSHEDRRLGNAKLTKTGSHQGSPSSAGICRRGSPATRKDGWRCRWTKHRRKRALISSMRRQQAKPAFASGTSLSQLQLAGADGKGQHVLRRRQRADREIGEGAGRIDRLVEVEHDRPAADPLAIEEARRRIRLGLGLSGRGSRIAATGAYRRTAAIRNGRHRE